MSPIWSKGWNVKKMGKILPEIGHTFSGQFLKQSRSRTIALITGVRLQKESGKKKRYSTNNSPKSPRLNIRFFSELFLFFSCCKQADVNFWRLSSQSWIPPILTPATWCSSQSETYLDPRIHHWFQAGGSSAVLAQHFAPNIKSVSDFDFWVSKLISLLTGPKLPLQWHSKCSRFLLAPWI